MLGIGLGLTQPRGGGPYTLNFATLATEAMSTRFGWSRTGAATMIDSGQLVKYGEHNLQTYSDDFTNADWIKRGTATITAGAIAGPVTGSSGTLFENIRAAPSGDVYRQNLTLNAVPVFPTFWVKRVSTSGTLRVIGANGAANGRYDINMALLPDAWSRIAPGNAALTVVTAFVPPGTVWGGLLFECTSGAPISFYASTVRIQYGQLGAEAADSATIATSAARYLMRSPDYTHSVPGLLLEGERTNLLPYSDTLAGAGWDVQGATRTTAAGTNPNGSGTVTTLAITANVGNNLKLDYTAAGTAQTASCSVRGTLGQKVFFSADSSTAASQVEITFTGEWQRVTSTSPGSGTTAYVGFEIYNRNGGAHLPNVTFDVWGAQLEVGAYAASYIPNPTATTTSRAADSADIGPGAEFNALFPPATLGVELVTNGNFDDATGWTLDPDWVITGGQAVKSAGAGNAQAIISLTTTGKRYKVSFDVIAISGILRIYLGATEIIETTPGSKVHYVTASAASLLMYQFGGSTCTLDNLSVREASFEGTLVLEWVDMGATTGDILTFHLNGATTELISFYYDAGALKISCKAGNVSQLAATLGTPTASALNKASVSWGAAGLSAVLNGGTVQANAGATLPAPTHARFTGAALVQADAAAWKPTATRTRTTQLTGAALQAITV